MEIQKMGRICIKTQLFKEREMRQLLQLNGDLIFALDFMERFEALE
jgi:hypothetical protein